MGLVREFFTGVASDERQSLPVDTSLTGTVPIQHLNSEGLLAVENLPIVQRCNMYIADMINQTIPQTVDDDGVVRAKGLKLPLWIRQPSTEFVLKELVQQSVVSMFLEGDLRMLGQVPANNKPVAVYVGSSNIIVSYYGGAVEYVDYSPYYAGNQVIRANRISHRRRLAVPGRPMSVSPAQAARNIINSALHAQDVTNRYFASNFFLDLLFTYDGEYVKGAGNELLASLAKKHLGGKNAFRPLVTDRKFKVERIRDSNQANQYIEIVQDINTKIVTSVFGLDPLVFSLGSSTGASLTYQNASNLRSQVWLQAIKPVADLIADCITDYLPPGIMFDFNASDMLRGSPADRALMVVNMALAEKHRGERMFHLEEFREVLGYRGAPPATPVPVEAGTDSNVVPISSAVN